MSVLARSAGGRVLTSGVGADVLPPLVMGADEELVRDTLSKGNWTWTGFADIAVDATGSVW